MGEIIPAGFTQLEFPSLTIVARAELLADIRAALATGTLYDFAQTRPNVQKFKGRGAALAFKAPLSQAHIVVRRSRHGGLLAPVTGELFLRPGRAPHELRTATTLRERGVPTAEVMAFVRYWQMAAFCRTDVVTRFIPRAQDLAELLMANPDQELRAQALSATALLLTAMADARAHHPDINLRNVLIAGDARSAWVLDVDTVAIDSAPKSDVAMLNAARLLRSAKKLNIALTDAEVSLLSGAGLGA